MWLIDGTLALFTDLYELTMAQVYFRKRMDRTARFEVTVRRLPEHWSFFVMAGLNEIESYLRTFRFRQSDIAYLKSVGIFDEDFLDYLHDLQPRIAIRAMPEGTLFFPGEPILEVSGPIIDAQLLETYILNILGFSIIEATLAARTVVVAGDIPVVDFGLRRCQGPIASMRAARAAQLAGFKGTSNVFAARALDFTPSGTMAHSFIQIHASEEAAFHNFVEIYADASILLVDTYDAIEGIRTAARVASHWLDEKGVRIKGIRIDSGNLAELSLFARTYFRERGLDFLKIFVSGDLDEYRIHDLLERGAQIDGIGIGTRFGSARHAPAIEIVYKIVQYDGRGLAKTSPNKTTLPGSKTVTRITSTGRFQKDIVGPIDPEAHDLLQPFTTTEPAERIQERLTSELAALPDAVKTIRNPTSYPVEFRF